MIKQYIPTEKPRRQRRNATKSKVFKSTIDELARATASGTTRHPENSGNEDTINKLLNDNSKLINENKQLKSTNNPQNPQVAQNLQNPLVLLTNNPQNPKVAKIFKSLKIPKSLKI